MHLSRIYKMLQRGDRAEVGETYLIDHFKRGFVSDQKRKDWMRPSAEHQPALMAWLAGRDAFRDGKPNPYT